MSRSANPLAALAEELAEHDGYTEPETRHWAEAQRQINERSTAPRVTVLLEVEAIVTTAGYGAAEVEDAAKFHLGVSTLDSIDADISAVTITDVKGRTPDRAPAVHDDPFSRIKRLTEHRDRLNAAIHAEGRRLHDDERRPYAAIGRALGVTRQAAWERFGKR